MSGYTKLHSSILASTIWLEKNETRLVWVTMLAMTDADGIVEASIPGLASFARVGVSDCEEAIRVLSSPDPYSRTKDHEGKRIQPVDGGWRILTYAKHRERHNPDERREYKRRKQAEYRKRGQKKSTIVHESPHGQKVDNVDTGRGIGRSNMQKQDQDLASYRDPEKSQPIASDRTDRARARDATVVDIRPHPGFQHFWDCYPKKAKRADAEFVWNAMKPTTAMVADMLNALAWQVKSPAWKDQGGRFIPSAKDWLLDKRWEEKPPVDESDAALQRVLSGNARLMP